MGNQSSLTTAAQNRNHASHDSSNSHASTNNSHQPSTTPTPASPSSSGSIFSKLKRSHSFSHPMRPNRNSSKGNKRRNTLSLSRSSHSLNKSSSLAPSGAKHIGRPSQGPPLPSIRAQSIDPPYLHQSINTLKSQHRLLLTHKNLDMLPKSIRDYLRTEFLDQFEEDCEQSKVHSTTSNKQPSSSSTDVDTFSTKTKHDMARSMQESEDKKNATSTPHSASTTSLNSLSDSEGIQDREKLRIESPLGEERSRESLSELEQNSFEPPQTLRTSTSTERLLLREKNARKITEINVSCNRFGRFRYILLRNLNFALLEELNVGYNRIETVPKNIAKRCPNLRSLNIAGNLIKTLPTQLKNLKHLLILDMSNNDFSLSGTLPECILEIPSLRKLMMSNIGLRELPEELGRKLPNLNTLNASKNRLTTIPRSMGYLKRLSQLVLFENAISSIPEELGRCPLNILELDSNQLTSLPPCLFQIKELHELYLANNQLKELPEVVSGNSSLEVLELDSNQISTLPDSFSNLRRLAVLQMPRNNLTCFNVDLPVLSDLSLAHNRLTSYPDCLCNTRSLFRLNLSYNALKSLPDLCFENNHELRQINFTHCQLDALPESILHLPSLEVLLAGDNQINRIPNTQQFRESMKKLVHLSLWGNNLSYHQIMRLLAPDYQQEIVPFPKLRTLHMERNSHLTDSRWSAPVVKQKILGVAQAYSLCDFEFSIDLSQCLRHVHIHKKPEESSFVFGRAHFQGVFRSTMEDAMVVDQVQYEGEPVHLFAVLDGHGGDKVAIYSSKHLPSVLQSVIDKNPRVAEERSPLFHLKWCVQRALDRITVGLRNMDSSRSMTDGSTLIMALLWKRQCVVVNVGDSRAVACTRRGKRAVRLSRDHKASDPIEKERITEMGGIVDSRERILGLALSRSLGDFDLLPFVNHDCEFCTVDLDCVSPVVHIEEIEDDISGLRSNIVVSVDVEEDKGGGKLGQEEENKGGESLRLEEENGIDAAVTNATVATTSTATSSATIATTPDGYQFLVLACDGIYDVLKDQEVCNEVNYILSKCGNEMTAESLDYAAHHLRDYAACCGSSDNISVIIIAL